jgi:hypothetical protein
MDDPASSAQSKVVPQSCMAIVMALSLLMILFQFGLARVALADQPDIAVDIIPNAVSIPPNQQNGQQGQTSNDVQVDVEVTNLTNNTLQALQLCWFTNVAVTVAAANASSSGNCFVPLINTLAPGAQQTWDVKLAQSKDRLIPGNVEFLVNYKRPVNGQPGGVVDRTTFASLSVQDLKPEVAQQVASVEVATSLTALNEQQPGQIYLLVTNTSDFQLQVNRLISQGPDFIMLDARGFKDASNGQQQVSNTQQQANKCNSVANESRDEVPEDSMLIPPRQSITIAIDVSTSCPVQPGNQLLVFQVGIQWQDEGQLQTGNLVAHQAVQLGVLGSSEILTLLGIPSFLFLPGFLALITVRLLWQISTQKPAEDYPLKTVSPEFGLIAVTISGIAAFLYPPITQWFTHVRRDYLVRYDLSDIVYIWLASVGLAIAGYFLVGACLNLWKRYLNWYVQQRTPAESDSPIEILYKLDRQGLDIQRYYVDLKVDGESPHAYLLQGVDEQEKLWLSPTIVVHWKDGASQQLQDEVTNRIKQGNARLLADLLSKENHTAWEVTWRPLKIHDKPFQVKREEITSFARPQSIVETES